MIYRTISSMYHALLKRKREIFIRKLVNNGLRLGKDVHIIDTFFFDPSHCFLISIGDNCTICPNVRLIAHDASTKIFLGYTKIGRIDVHENSFLGDSVIVLPNVTIGPNSIVGAGSVVTKDVSPNSVAAGNPARVISSLDEYLEKVRSISKTKGVFSKEYAIHMLDGTKRNEVLKSLEDSIGFII